MIKITITILVATALSFILGSGYGSQIERDYARSRFPEVKVLLVFETGALIPPFIARQEGNCNGRFAGRTVVMKVEAGWMLVLVSPSYSQGIMDLSAANRCTITFAPGTIWMDAGDSE